MISLLSPALSSYGNSDFSILYYEHMSIIYQKDPLFSSMFSINDAFNIPPPPAEVRGILA